MTTFSRHRLLALLATGALFASGCSGGSGSTSDPLSAVSVSGAAEDAVAESAEPDAPTSDGGAEPETPDSGASAEPTVAAAPEANDNEGDNAEDEVEVEEEPAEPAGENELPEVTVIDITSGDEVLLSSYAPAATPIVLWFWAPH